MDRLQEGGGGAGGGGEEERGEGRRKKSRVQHKKWRSWVAEKNGTNERKRNTVNAFSRGGVGGGGGGGDYGGRARRKIRKIQMNGPENTVVVVEKEGISMIFLAFFRLYYEFFWGG